MANQGAEQVTGVNPNPSEVNYVNQTQQSTNLYLTSSVPPPAPQSWSQPHNGYPQNYYYGPNQAGSNPAPQPNPQQYQNPSTYYTPYQNQNSNTVPVQYNYSSSEYSSNYYSNNNTAKNQVQNNTGAPSYQPPFSQSQTSSSTTTSTNYGDPQNNPAPAVQSANYYYPNQNQGYTYPGYSAAPPPGNPNPGYSAPPPGIPNPGYSAPPPGVQSGNPNPGSYQYQYNNNSQWPYPPPGTTTGNYQTNQPPPPGIAPPPPGTSQWRADSAPASYSSVQEMGGQYQYPGQYQMYPPKPVESAPKPINNNQQNFLYSQNPNLNPSANVPVLNPIPYPAKLPETRPVLEGSKMALPPPPLYKTVLMANTTQVSKMQVPTNPRNSTGTVKGSGTENSNINNNINNNVGVKKPAYLSVSVPKSDSDARKNTQDADSLCKGAFPVALRGYVERSFARCKTDSQRAVNENLMKEVITKASADGSLYTKNWDVETLFPLPAANSTNKNMQDSSIFSQVPKTRRKSRWDTIEEETPQKKIEPFNISLNTSASYKYINNNNNKNNNINYSAKDTSSTRPDATPKSDAKGWNYVKFIPAQKHSTFNKSVPAQQQQKSKKRKFGFSQKPGSQIHDSSSDSNKEKELTKYYSSAISLANNPEEKKRRESRSKRFDKRKIENFAQSDNSIIQRKASAMLIAKSYNSENNNSYSNNGSYNNNNNNLAVEDIDWDSLTVKGTCQEIEKKYLRLTSAPDPATVRPEEVLEKALEMVQKSNRNYLYKCDQLKSIRQDLTVQRIQNELTVKVYETHARLSMQSGDMAEYNQCQSQLKGLYKEGIKGCKNEFSAYHLLHVSLHSHNKRDLLSSMSRLSIEAKEDEAVKHALKVRSAVSSGNYVLFFKLYKSAPNLNTSLMDLYVEKMRFEAVKCMAKAYRPNLPVRYVNQVLGFLNDYQKEEKDEKENKSGLEECEQWLRAHGAFLTQDSNGDLHFDTKASMASLFMPEPENAVSHGDASLAVNDFLTRAL